MNFMTEKETEASPRIFLSPPCINGEERSFVEAAFQSNWLAPVGPNLGAFEEEMCAASGAASALCVSSGTAALHLAVRLIGAGADDEVFCSSFTFVASANPILYQGARPVFIDSEERSWNMDPSLLAEALESRARQGRLPKAIIVTDIYGQCADWRELYEVAAPYEVPFIEDAAEAVGATYAGRWAGTFGLLGAYSFNGNKILTTSGGGMLLSSRPELVRHAAKLATQARDDAPHYEHSEVGFNYRLSNVLAGIGRGQLKTLEGRVKRRREIFEFYKRELSGLPGVEFMPELAQGRSTHWLSCLTIDPARAGVDRDTVLMALSDRNIEARPLWKPLHTQTLFAAADKFGGSVCERLFATGLCLPSGSAMTDEQLQRVAAIIRKVFAAA